MAKKNNKKVNNAPLSADKVLENYKNSLVERMKDRISGLKS